jgi:hypothetical protein
MGNKTTEAHAVNITNTSARVTGCTFINFSRVIMTSGGNDSVITNNTFLNNTEGIAWPVLSSSPISYNLTISFNLFNASGIGTGGSGSIVLVGATHDRLNVSYNNFTYGTANEVWANGSATIVGNRFVNISRSIINLQQGSYSNITGNTAVNSSFEVIASGQDAVGITFSASEYVNASYNTISGGQTSVRATSGQSTGGSNYSFIAFNTLSFANTTGISALNNIYVNISNNTIFNITNTSTNGASNAISTYAGDDRCYRRCDGGGH